MVSFTIHVPLIQTAELTGADEAQVSSKGEAGEVEVDAVDVWVDIDVVDAANVVNAAEAVVAWTAWEGEEEEEEDERNQLCNESLLPL